MIVKTEGGSTYEFTDALTHVRRTNVSHGMRLDGDWVGLHNHTNIQVGHGMILVLDGLGEESAHTYRHTSRVTEVIDA